MSLLDKICQSLIKMIRKKDSTKHVWSNASPSSGFGAQTLKIDLSEPKSIWKIKLGGVLRSLLSDSARRCCICLAC